MSALPETTQPQLSVIYGFGDDFDAELEAASQFTPKEDKPRATFKATPGMKTTFAKAGKFTQKFVTEDGEKAERTTTALEGVIIDASFNREYWVTDAETGKDKIICQTVAHRTPQDAKVIADAKEAGEEVDEDLRTGTGKWQIPYAGMLAMEKYNPMGSRGKSCAECIACGDHGKPANDLKGEKGCSFKGSIILAQTAFDLGPNPMGKQQGMFEMDEPQTANIQTPVTSGVEFQKYNTKLKKERTRLTDVKTRLTIKPAGPTNVLVFNNMEPVGPEFVQKAMGIYTAEIAQIEAERKANAEAKKAEYEAKQAAGNGKKGNGKKAAAPSASEENYEL